MLTTEIIRILEDREIDTEVVARLGVDEHSGHGPGGDWISIPYFVGGKVVNHKYRSLSGEKRFTQDKDATKCFYNLDCLLGAEITDDDFLIITEGEFDAWTLIQLGYDYVLSVPDGAPAQSIEDGETSKYDYVNHAAAMLKPFKSIIIMSDADGPGQNLRNDLALRLGKFRCKHVKYPAATKDANEILIRYGPPEVHKTIRAAKWLTIDGVYRMGELPDLPERPALSPGFGTLDNHFKVRTGDLSVVTGIPNMGKTTWVNDLGCRMADNHGWVVAHASFEQPPQTQHRRNLRQWKMQALPDDMYAKCSIAEADKWIDEQFLFIMPGDNDWPNMDWMLEKMEVAALRHHAKMVIIDPWNEIEHEKPRGMSTTEYIGSALRQLKRFARVFDVHISIVAHPTKMPKDNKGAPTAPTLNDISDSANWYNKADLGVVVHREGGMNSVDVQKVRDQEVIGRPGRDWFELNTLTRRFQVAASPDDMQ